MERQVSDRNILLKFTKEFCDILEKHAKYIIVSGFVAILSGRMRATEDIDVIIERIKKDKFRELHNQLVDNNFTCMQTDEPDDIYEYLEENASVRYTWLDRPVPELELKFAKDVIDDEQLKTRQKLELTGTDFWFSSVEWNIAFKEEYLKSEKDLEDAKHLRLAYNEGLGEEKIAQYKQLLRKIRL